MPTRATKPTHHAHTRRAHACPHTRTHTRAHTTHADHTCLSIDFPKIYSQNRLLAHIESALPAIKIIVKDRADDLRDHPYDAADRLAKTILGTTFVGTDTIAGNELARHSYLHNALGQRTFKSEPQTEATALSETTLGSGFVSWLRTNFSWLCDTAQTNATLGDSYLYAEEQSGIPSWALLGEYGNGGSNSTGRTEYLWLPQDAGGGIGGSGNQAIPVGIYRAGQFYSLQTDHLGTPRVMKNNQNIVVWQWPYSAFGENQPSGTLRTSTSPNSAIAVQSNGAGQTPTYLITSSAAQKINLRFAGQYFDSESNLHYNYFRNYQPTQGRYTQNDPIGLNGGWNRMGYSLQDAISKFDPLGLGICYYSISTGRMTCYPDTPNTSGFQGDFASGNNSVPGCKNNPDCTATTGVGPIPTGVWRWDPNGQTSKPGGRVLEPVVVDANRTLIRTHSCANPFGPSTKGPFCSEGCVTGTPQTISDLNTFLDREAGNGRPNVLVVVP
jgi:RHS repeat-associated protein